jgi:hypothetical protein
VGLPPPLFDAARHEALRAGEWNPAAVEASVRRIADDALEHLDRSSALWPTHPADEPEPPDARYAMLYFGAGGVLWALERLQRQAGIRHGLDIAALLPALIEHNRATTAAWGQGDGSYLMGESGLRLLQWSLTHDDAVAQRLYTLVEGDLDHPSREALWGAPGSLLAVLQMAQSGAGDVWATLFARGADGLWEQMEFDDQLGAWLWRQDLYGKRVTYLGAGHGFVGNVYPFLCGAAWLKPERVAALAERALATLQATVLRDDRGGANWPAYIQPPPTGRVPLVQDCHGAPGVLVRCARAPRSAAWDTLLDAAGELTWHAGPLAKGAGLCHGTAGNGYALLALYRRSGHPRWLERARAFALHALAQVEAARAAHGQGRHSLWTGDVGVALYALDCLRGEPHFPTLDDSLA